MNISLFKKAFQFGWTKTQENLVFLIRSSAAVLFITFILNGLQGAVTDESIILGAFFFALTFALDMIIKIGYTKVYLDLTDNIPVRLRDVFSPHKKFSTYCVGYVLLSLITIAGLMMLIVPGLFIISSFIFVPFLIIDKDMQVREAFRKSYKITQGKRLYILNFLLAAFIFNVVGLLFFVIGLFFTIPITHFSIIYLYRYLMGQN